VGRPILVSSARAGLDFMADILIEFTPDAKPMVSRARRNRPRFELTASHGRSITPHLDFARIKWCLGRSFPPAQ
jgi:hypothetical protein